VCKMLKELMRQLEKQGGSSAKGRRSQSKQSSKKGVGHKERWTRQNKGKRMVALPPLKKKEETVSGAESATKSQNDSDQDQIPKKSVKKSAKGRGVQKGMRRGNVHS